MQARLTQPDGAEVVLRLAQQDAADALLSRDAFALLVGMLLDQQFPMERAFSGPELIARRLGVEHLDPELIADHDPEAFVALMTGPPAVHRYPGSMAARVQALAAAVVGSYEGDAAAIWRDVGSGAELLRRLKALPGFGDAKARIFVALLGKQVGVRPPGWQEVAADYARPGYRSAADVVDLDTLQKVRDHKKSVKAQARSTR